MVTKEEQGSINYCAELHDVNFKQGKWLVLVQANYMLLEIGNILDEKNLYWQRRNSTPAIKNLYAIIQKWNELKTGVPMHYNDCKKYLTK